MPNDNPEEKKNKGPEPLPLKHKKMRNPFGKTGKKNRLLPKAFSSMKSSGRMLVYPMN